MDKEQKNKIGSQVVKKYKEEILPMLARFEQERVKKSKITKSILITCMVACLISTILFLLYPSKIDGVIVSIAVIVSFCSLYMQKAFEKEVKSKVMPPFCSCFGDLKWISPVDSFEYENLFLNANLFKTNSTSTFSYDDVFKGSFSDVPFEIIEMTSSTQETTYSDGKPDTEHVTQFKGVVVKLKMNKNFEKNTVILSNYQNDYWLNASLKRSEFEDVVFEKKFNVYTQDEVEARYLITTAFMERLNNLQVAFDVTDVSCSFTNKQFLIALHTSDDLFSLGTIFDSLTDYSIFSNMFKQLISVYDLIDYFKLNENTKL